ncbi:MAG TPA: DUF4832 domain-containing protein [Lentisphaeria bacterium]|nr:DUF4832 domain-containing protein [Lentisphaeria bacterium]
MQKTFRGIRPDDWHGRMGLRNPERGFRTEMYFSTIPGEVAGMCSCHHKRNKLDGRSEKPVFQNIDIPGVHHLIRGNRLDGIEFSHGQWQDELDFFGYDGITIMQSYCFLMRYNDGQDLPTRKLDDIEGFFLKLRESKVKALLRFAYELSPTLTGPTAATTLKHLSQLRPLLRKYSDVIYVLQCGFIGQFGEWHNSYHQLQRDQAFHGELFAAVLEALPPERRTMVRYPVLKMNLYGSEPLREDEAFAMTPRARIGHFNDGFLASKSHGGTFGRSDSLVSADAEKDYLAQEGRFLPMDGELFWRDLCGMALPTEATMHLARWHYDTFGFVHGNSLFEGDKYSIDVWKVVPVDPMFLRDANLPVSDSYFVDAHGQHVWRSYYEYIRDHLGYRLELTRAEMPEQVQCGHPFDVTVELVNCGFASPVNPRPVFLVLRQGEAEYTFAFDTDIQRWAGHGTSQKLSLTVALPKEAPAGSYAAGLWLPDGSGVLRNDHDYAIRCANPLDFHSGVNWLGMKVIAQPA